MKTILSTLERAQLSINRVHPHSLPIVEEGADAVGEMMGEAARLQLSQRVELRQQQRLS